MRIGLLFLTVLGAVAALAACNDARSPTGRSGPAFGLAGSGDSTSRDTTGLPSHYIANGATADVSWYFEGGDSLNGGGGWKYGYVSVNRTNQVYDEWTSVNWSISDCDGWWSCSYSSGYGYVHGDVLAGSGGADLRLAVDPSAHPADFYVYGDPMGPIELTWRQAGGYASRTSGNTENTYPGYRFKSNGVSVTSSAIVTGHVGGYVLPAGTFGNMGTNHSMTIVFYR